MRAEIVLPALHAGQRRLEAEAARFNVVSCGRRFGKSKHGLVRAIAHPKRGSTRGCSGWVVRAQLQIS